MLSLVRSKLLSNSEGVTKTIQSWLKKYKELVDSTIVVLIAMVLLAGFVQFWDFAHVLIVGFLNDLTGFLFKSFGH